MRTLSLICIWFVIHTTLDAQSFSVNLNRDSILLGNTFTINYKLEDIDGDFEAPDFNGAIILSGPNMSSSFEYINGESSSSTTYSYIIKPTEIGELIIDQAFVKIDDSHLSTDFIKVFVYPNPEGIIQEDEPSQTEFRYNLPWNLPLNPSVPKESKRKKKLKKI